MYEENDFNVLVTNRLNFDKGSYTVFTYDDFFKEIKDKKFLDINNLIIDTFPSVNNSNFPAELTVELVNNGAFIKAQKISCETTSLRDFKDFYYQFSVLSSAGYIDVTEINRHPVYFHEGQFKNEYYELKIPEKLI